MAKRSIQRSTASGDGDDDEVDVVSDGIVLSTFHRAKGLEWPTVFVIGMSEGLVPFASARTDMALDEERRLLYVALTRSINELWCSWAEFDSTVAASSGAKPRKPSRWLGDIEDAIHQLRREAKPSDAATVAARIAELRAQLETTSGADQ